MIEYIEAGDEYVRIKSEAGKIVRGRDCKMFSEVVLKDPSGYEEGQLMRNLRK